MSVRRALGVRLALLTTILFGVLSLGGELPSLGTSVAHAGLGNPISANEYGDPVEEFADNHAVFVYVNSDIRGGEVCIVSATYTNASGLDCSSAAWGGKNTVVGIGLQYALIAAPPLKPGHWRLLATDSTGGGGQLSAPFLVYPCQTGECDFTIANNVISGIKAAAEDNIIGAATTCLTFSAKSIKGVLVKARGRTKTLTSTANDYSTGGGFAALIVGGASFGLSFASLPSLSNPGEEMAMGILKDLTCTLTSMYSDIAADPPDPAYGTVAMPEFSIIPTMPDAARDQLAHAVDRQRGFGVALLHALERYQGAVADESIPSIAAQADAVDKNATELIAEVRRSAAALRSYAIQLDSDPDFSVPVLTPDERAALVQIYDRVRNDGFTTDERSQLQDLAYSAEEISIIRSHFDVDPTKLPTNEKAQQVLRQLASITEASIPAWDLLARSAAAVAGRAALSGGNRAPVAVEDQLTATAGTGETIDVLANDSDPDGDPLSVAVFTDGGSGNVSCTPTGQCTYTASVVFAGSDSFTYTASDGKGGTDVGTVNVTVTPPGNASPAATDDSLSTEFNQIASVNVLANDADVDGDSLSVTAFTQGASGSVSCTASGNCTYTPSVGFSGPDSFTYTVSDGKGGSDQGTVAVTVNALANGLPVAVDDVLSTQINQAGSLNVLTNDSDADNDSLSVSAFTQGASGGVSCGSSGTCTYTPNASFYGSDSFTYTASDGKGGTATATVGVTVAPAPLLADFALPSHSTNEGQSTPFTPVVSGHVFPVTVQWNVQGGAVTTVSGSNPAVVFVTRSLVFPLDGDIPVSLTVSDAAGRSVTVTKTVHVLNVAPTVTVGVCTLPGVPENASAAIELTPCSWSIFDPGLDDRNAGVQCSWDWGDGTPTSNARCPSFAPKHTYATSGTFTLTVTATDIDGASTTRAITVVVRKQDTFVNVVAIPDEDPGTRVTARLWQRPTLRHGWIPYEGAPISLRFGTQTQQLTTDGDGVAEVTFGGSAAAVSAQFAEAAAYFGASDEDPVPGSQLPAGDVIFMIDESGSMSSVQQGIKQNVSLIGSQLGASIDPQFGIVGFGDGAPTDSLPHAQRPLTDNLPQLDAGLAELSLSGGFEPGYDAMVFAMSDLMGLRPQAGVCAILFADEAPQSRDVTKAGALAALQSRNATLFAVVNPTLNDAGYMDLALETGGAWFDIRTFATSPQPLLTAILDRCVDEVIEDTDDPPVAVDDSLSVDEGAPATSVDVLANDTDTDGGPKTVESVTQPANGTVVVAADKLSLTYMPQAGYCNDGTPTDNFTYTLNGGSSATVSATVTCADEPPTAADDSATVAQDAPATAVDVLANDTDTDGGPKTVKSVTQPANGTVVVAADKLSLTYVPQAGYCNDGTPTDNFTYTLNGGSTATVMLTVTCVNVAPVLSGPSAAGGQYSDPIAPLTVSATDADTPIAGFAYSLNSAKCTDAHAVANLTIAKNGDGTATISGRLNVKPGVYQLCVVVSDGEGGEDARPIEVTVSPEDASIVDVGPAVTLAGSPVALKGTFREANDGYPSSDLTSSAAAKSATRVTFALTPAGPGTTGASCTDASGVSGAAVGCTGLIPALAVDRYDVVAMMTGDWFTGGGTGSLIAYAFAPGGGAFVVGDKTATGTVMFWGSQWSKKNTLSGGGAPSAFKGYALNPKTPSCKVDWSTGPGNSPPPPQGPLPAYMGVIVSGKVKQSGSTITGTTVRIVIVRPNAGYTANPGHSATGTVVATAC
jgi:hypothetical protein